MSPLFRLRLALLRKPQMIEAPLGESFEALQSRLPGLTLSDSPSDWVDGVNYTLKLPDYTFYATVKDDRVVAVIHNTDRYRDTGPQRIKKLFYFLEIYAGESSFEQVLDNGFGFSYKTKDDKVCATHSYVCDIFSAYYRDLVKRSDPPNDGNQSESNEDDSK